MQFISSFPAGGTLFNVVTVILGGILGLSAGRFIPERLHGRFFECMGLFTLYLGMGMAMETKHALAILLALILGTLTGAAFNLDDRLNGLGDTLKAKMHVIGSRFRGKESPETSDARFTEGFVTATLLFCIGAMSIIGAFEDGLRHNPSLLVTKGVMDGISAIVLIVKGKAEIAVKLRNHIVLCSFIVIAVELCDIFSLCQFYKLVQHSKLHIAFENAAAHEPQLDIKGVAIYFSDNDRNYTVVAEFITELTAETDMVAAVA